MLDRARCHEFAGFEAGPCGPLGFHRAPLVAGHGHLLAALGKRLSFARAHCLVFHAAVFAAGHLGEWCGYEHAVLLEARRAGDGLLGGPGARRSGAEVVTTVLVGRAHGGIPCGVAAMGPALAGIDRVIANAAGLVGIRGVVSALLIAVVVVVPEIIVVVAGPHEKRLGQHAQVDCDGWRIGIARMGIDSGIKIHRCEKRAAPAHRIIPVAAHENVAARRPHIMRGTPIPVGPAACPISRTPRIAIVIPHPVARRPAVVR